MKKETQNNVDLGKNTYKITLVRSKSRISLIIGTILPPPPQKTIITCFAVIQEKPVEILFEQKIDNIKEFNKNYVTL